jgi:hypothetical protein
VHAGRWIGTTVATVATQGHDGSYGTGIGDIEGIALSGSVIEFFFIVIITTAPEKQCN